MTTVPMSGDRFAYSRPLLAISVHEEATVSETVDRVLTFARQAVDCSHAGVVFIHSRRRIESVAATDEAVHTLERTQTRLGEGPDLSLSRGDRDVLVDDTARESRWPGWAAAAADLGLRSMVGARLYTSARTIGNISLSRLRLSKLYGFWTVINRLACARSWSHSARHTCQA